MKTYSNIPIPDTLVWKGTQKFIAINHKENPVTVDEDEGKRYEADFTIVDELTAESAINAFTRQSQDTELEKAVVYNFEVEGKPAIEVKTEYQTKVSTSIFKPLPDVGSLEKGQIYSYGNGAVMVVQDHERTTYAPELTPALFSFYRTVTEGMEWIVGEAISINETRTYNGKTYKCIQAHQSQQTWNPELTVGVLWSVVPTNDYANAPQWVSGNWGQYVMGFIVKDSGKIWRVKGVTHTWIKPALTGNGAISWEYVQDVV